MAQALDGASLGSTKIIARVVPCTFFKCIDFVQAAITEVQPNLVIMLGEYGGRSLITVERLAQNLNDSARYQLADSDGLVLQDTPTVPGGPVAYYTTVPIRAMVTALRQAGIPADISDTPVERVQSLSIIVRCTSTPRRPSSRSRSMFTNGSRTT